MEKQLPSPRRSVFATGFVGGLGLVCAVVLALAVREAASILLLILVALFLAIGLHPAVSWLQRRGLNRGLAVTVVALAVTLLGCSGIVALVPPLVSQSDHLVDAIPTYLDKIGKDPQLAEFLARYDLVNRLKSAATPETLGQALSGVFGGVLLFFGLIFNIVTAAVLTIYFLAAWQRLKEGFYRLFPANRREQAQAVGDEIFEKFGAYLLGSLAVALLAGVFAFAFFLIAGVPYAFALASVVAVCDLIPQIGAMLGAIVGVIAGFAVSIEVGVACIIFFIVYQQVENWLIAPRIMKRSVDISDLAVILSALVGAVLLGAVGALIAIPVTAALQLILRRIIIPSLDRAGIIDAPAEEEASRHTEEQPDAV
ncbi:AI-2E family transporter [Catellatospora tritici]|uniref:AI-2E family transporter n=1 Tax=Catellatospora tritici TaxID=2851566 RepID=UPI001C2D646E|nr:AI-2E family transporter [Catellatospora tritici]MBV1854478.1 AI-2E family transporter [Catellatospora tritici]